MAEWLSAAEAAGLVQASAGPTDADWAGDVAAAVEYVEGKRGDLFNTDDPPVFVAGPMIKLGTAMLANRLYARRTSPLGASQNVEFGGSDFLRQDPDIAKLLGIGIEGKPVFGGARAAEIDAALAAEA